VPQSGYDQIASEYYDGRHITSRNFDRATQTALANQGFADTAPAGLVLEIGAGRGRSTEFLNIPPSRIVQLDNSEKMLSLNPREPCLVRVHADACRIPLVSHQFAAVTGFLVDPFLGLDSLAEAYRMLVDGGRLLLTTPTKVWGEPLRKQLKIDVMTTRFKLVAREGTIILPSILHSSERINEMLRLIGFRSIRVTVHHLPEGESQISDDITSVCKELGLSNYHLPIVHVITAQR
jgi:ubiquinone/menaquinone biosynthesis C-methylase UbiE